MELLPESPVTVQSCTLFKGCVFFEGQRERKGLGVQTTTLLLLVLLLFLCVKPPNLKPRVVYTNQLFISCGSN